MGDMFGDTKSEKEKNIKKTKCLSPESCSSLPSLIISNEGQKEGEIEEIKEKKRGKIYIYHDHHNNNNNNHYNTFIIINEFISCSKFVRSFRFCCNEKCEE